MHTFIEKNKDWLNFYRTAAMIIGWILLLGGGVWFALVVKGPFEKVSYDRGRLDILLYACSAFVFDFSFPALIILWVTSFIRCLLVSEYKPGPILRNGKAVLYGYAIFLIGGAAIKYFWYIKVAEQLNSSPTLFAQPLLLPIAAKILILIGLGNILKRIMPVIEESKTLV